MELAEALKKLNDYIREQKPQDEEVLKAYNVIRNTVTKMIGMLISIPTSPVDEE